MSLFFMFCTGLKKKTDAWMKWVKMTSDVRSIGSNIQKMKTSGTGGEGDRDKEKERDRQIKGTRREESRECKLMAKKKVIR